MRHLIATAVLFTIVTFCLNSAQGAERKYILPTDYDSVGDITYYPDPNQSDIGNSACVQDPYYLYYEYPSPHEGMDFIIPVGTPIYAAAAGYVTRQTESCGGSLCYGNYLYVNHGGNNWTLYAHLSSYVASTGQYVEQGELIAYSGSSGTSTPHLHWEVLTGYSAAGGNPHNPFYCDDEWFLTSPPMYAADNFRGNSYFENDSGYPIACADYPTATGSPNWDYVCYNQRDTYQEGETAYVMTKIKNIPAYTSFYFEAGVYKNGEELWTSQISGVNYTDQWDWEDAFSWTTINYLTPGEYNVLFYVTAYDGGIYAGRWFAGSKQIHVNGPVYKYYDSLTTCKCGIQGGAQTNWYYTCKVNSDNIFYPGETAYGLLRLHDVYEDHRYKIYVYQDGNYRWEWVMPSWNEINQWGWNYSHFWYDIGGSDLSLGQWRYDIYVETAYGSGWEFLDSITFWVSYSAIPTNCN